MSAMHAASRLISAANRFGVFVPHPSGLTIELSEQVRGRLREVLDGAEGSELLESATLSAVEVESLTRALNAHADRVFRKVP